MCIILSLRSLPHWMQSPYARYLARPAYSILPLYPLQKREFYLSRAATALRQGHENSEGVAKVLMCYERYPNARNQNIRMMVRRNAPPSPVLPQLSRRGYCLPWDDPSRPATLLRPHEIGSTPLRHLQHVDHASSRTTLRASW